MAVAASNVRPGAQAPAQAINPYRWIILIGLVTGSVMEVLDTTVVNVALPQMMGNLGATTDEIGWVSTGYILSNVIVLPMTAWLSSRFGRRRYLAASIITFIGASFFCGTSHTLGELVFWRVIQGAGGAALLSTAQATLVEIFPPSEAGMVQALFGLGMITAPTIAPALGGWITDNYSWPWVFFINVPIGMISVMLVLTFLEDSIYARDTDQVDYVGIVLLTIGLFSLQYVLEEGLRWDWFADPTITRLSWLAAICLITWTFWELSPRNKHPIVDLHILKNNSLRMGVIMMAALGVGLYGGVFLYPMFAQHILHFTAIETGIALLPGGIASGIGMIFCGRMLNKKNPIEPRRLIAFGITMFVLAMWDLSHLTSQSGQWDAQAALIVRGCGLGFLFIPIAVAAFSTLRGRDIAQGSAMLNLARQLGGSFGIALLNTYVVHMQSLHRSYLVGYIADANQIYITRLHRLIGMFTIKGLSITAAKTAAQTLIDNSVNVQAWTLAYDDGFLLLGLLMLIAAPTILFIKRGTRPAEGRH